MADQPNRPKLTIPKEIKIPGTKVKVPGWTPFAAGALLIVLLVLWRKSSGGEAYEEEYDEEQALGDEIDEEAGEIADGTIGGDIGDITTPIPSLPEEPLVSIPDLLGLDEQPVDTGYEYFDQTPAPVEYMPFTMPSAQDVAASEARKTAPRSADLVPIASIQRVSPAPRATTKAKSGVSSAPAKTAPGFTRQTPIAQIQRVSPAPRATTKAKVSQTSRAKAAPTRAPSRIPVQITRQPVRTVTRIASLPLRLTQSVARQAGRNLGRLVRGFLSRSR